MSYFEIVRVVTDVLYFLLAAILAHFSVFAAAGVFLKKTYPKTSKVNRYGVIIPARNEEAVVGALIDSIRASDYPMDQLEIFVIAHNCTDSTATVARERKATVYEYDNPSENTMGFAFRYLFKCIERDRGTASFDGFILLNADNILAPDFISRLNDAFVACGGKSVITSFRNSKNFGTNLISGLYGMYFALLCRLDCRGRTALGCSTRVQGTGYLINSDIVKNGWPYVSLTEDWEFTVDQILFNNNIEYCDDAVFYDEQPTSVRIMWRQRVRWARGHLLVFYARFRDLVKSLFKKETRRRFSLYDITAYILPSPFMMVMIQALQLILYATAPLFDPTVSFRRVMLGETANFLVSDGLLFIWARSGIVSALVMMFTAALVFFLERRRIKGVSVFKRVLVTLCWPIFMAIQLPIDVQAVLSRNLGWKPIPHGDKSVPKG